MFFLKFIYFEQYLFRGAQFSEAVLNGTPSCARLALYNYEKQNMTKTSDGLYDYCTLKTVLAPNKPAFSVAKVSVPFEMN